MLKALDFKKILMKICAGVTYFILLAAISRIVRVLLSVVSGGMLTSLALLTGVSITGIIGDLVGFAAVSAFAYKVRVRREDLRRDYVSRIGIADTDTPEIFVVIPWGEFVFELAAAFAVFFVTQFLLAGRGMTAFVVFAAYMIVFAIADAYVWICVHREWETESNREG